MGKNHIERILHIDRLLREDAHPSRKEIAETFEVSVKTVERDLECDKILSLGSGSGGRMSNGRDIVEHILESWFSEERIRRLTDV